MGYAVQGVGTWLSWSPTWTGFSVDPTAVTARYLLNGNQCTVVLVGTNGTSNATTTTVTLPFLAKSGSLQVFASALSVDAGINANGWSRTRSGSNIMDCYRIANTITWTASGAKMFYFSFTYETS